MDAVFLSPLILPSCQIIMRATSDSSLPTAGDSS